MRRSSCGVTAAAHYGTTNPSADLWEERSVLKRPFVKLCWHQKKTRITLPLCPTSWICHVSLVSLYDPLLDQHTFCLSTVSHIDGSPAVSLNAVGAVGSRYDVIQVSPNHTGAA